MKKAIPPILVCLVVGLILIVRQTIKSGDGTKNGPPPITVEVPLPTPATSASNFIFPGEVREYDTNFERVGTDSGGTVLLQVYVVRGDGTGKWVPVTSTKKWQHDLDGETWAKDSPYMIWDVDLYKVTNRLRAKVPKDCPGSSFTLRYKER